MGSIKKELAVAGSLGLSSVLQYVAATAMDEQSFHLLYRQTAKPLRAYVARTLGNETYADDIVQEAYLLILRTAPATEDSRQLRAFLFRAASDLMVGHWRGRKHETQEPTAHFQEECSGAVDDISLRLDMARIFQKLKPQERQLLWLAYVEGFDHGEIAVTLGLSERSIRVLLYRAKQKLTSLLGDEKAKS